MQRVRFCFEAKQIPYQHVETDLRVKAKWHQEINGGLVPLLETPDGRIVFESAVLAEFAWNYGGDKGMPIWPHQAAPGDLAAAMATAAMRLEIVKIDKLINENFWGALLSRFQDEEKVAKLKAALPQFEEFTKTNLNGKNFFGGDAPMYLDFHCCPVFERLVLLENSPWQHGWDALDVGNTCPTLCELVKRWREHPVMKLVVVKKECNDKHLEHWLTKEPGVKAQLSLDYLTPLDA